MTASPPGKTAGKPASGKAPAAAPPPVAAKNAPARSSRTAVFLALIAWAGLVAIGFIAVVGLDIGLGTLTWKPPPVLLENQEVVDIQNAALEVFVLGVLYLLPSITAGLLKHPFFMPIMLLNLVLGWAIVPWIFALVAALWQPGPTFHYTIGRILGAGRPAPEE